MKHKTKRLFYGKWPYKIATWVAGGSRLRYCNPKNSTCYIDNSDISLDKKKKLVEFYNCYKEFYNENYRVRFEGSHVNFFVEDKSLFEKIKNNMNSFVVDTWEPENDVVLNALLDNKRIVFVEEYPHKIYTNKIVFKNIPLGQRAQLIKLLKKYNSEQVKISRCTEEYLLGNKFYTQDPFIYISDEKMLTFLALAANSYIKRTEKFVLKSSINTCLDQEQTCQPLVKA